MLEDSRSRTYVFDIKYNLIDNPWVAIREIVDSWALACFFYNVVVPAGYFTAPFLGLPYMLNRQNCGPSSRPMSVFRSPYHRLGTR